MNAYSLSALLTGGWLSATALAGAAVHDSNFAPDHILRVTNSQVAGGCDTRTSVVVNGTSPGPTLHVLPGGVTWIRVYNDIADQNLTMHWHGLTQRMAPFADGTPLASQWPIPPGHFFDYELATRGEDSGTYFYHSHVGLQAMSCSGPLIIDDCGTAPFNYDEERIFHFEDFFTMPNEQMTGDVTGNPFTWPGSADAILLNGKGAAAAGTTTTDSSDGNDGVSNGSSASQASGHDESSGHNEPSGHGQPSGKNGQSRGYRLRARDHDAGQDDALSSCSLGVIDVEPGKTYRFRFIGAMGLSFLTMGFEGHDNLTIVQVDGAEYNKPATTDHLQLGAGQRFDVLFKAKTQEELDADGSKSSYFIQWETRDGEAPGMVRGYGLLRYNLSAAIPALPANPVITLPEQVDDWMEYTFTPLFPDKNKAPTAEEVTRRVIIDVDLVQDNVTGRVVWELAHLSWTEASYQTPALVDIYQRGQDAVPSWDAAQNNFGWDPATRSFPARVGEVIEIILQNRGAMIENSGRLGTHPFHAHSKHYYDIGSGTGAYNADANNAKIEKLGYQPVKRDTTMLYKYNGTVAPGEVGGWRGWRIRKTDAGVWMIHCHILAHMLMGMQMVWVVGDAKDIKTIPFEDSQSYMTFGGSVMGNFTHDPHLYEYFNATTFQCKPIDGN
ncbi:multicopper oxidase-domain-containing protein [Cercophora newfieldiana]|uniref:Multicopper oxidase-domain-containing protein n=1 Tax=Cercophora newfieldiana TaxID=92897 RepID=A0AA39Y1B8_9PEZI|nr:multicopper oxidase-domain-containing protein [Cercophora newfieldiana]